MIKTLTKDVTVAANSETTESFLSGLDGVARTIRKIWWEVNAGVEVVAYIDQEKIVDASGDCDAFTELPIEVNAGLSTGINFRAGFKNNTGSSVTAKITVEYEER